MDEEAPETLEMLFLRVSAGDKAALREVHTRMANRLATIAARHGAELRDPVRAICGTGPACPIFFGTGEPRFADDKHLRPGFVAADVTFLDELFAPR